MGIPQGDRRGSITLSFHTVLFDLHCLYLMFRIRLVIHSTYPQYIRNVLFTILVVHCY